MPLGTDILKDLETRNVHHEIIQFYTTYRVLHFEKCQITIMIKQTQMVLQSKHKWYFKTNTKGTLNQIQMIL